jgi:hypothetical protein
MRRVPAVLVLVALALPRLALPAIAAPTPTPTPPPVEAVQGVNLTPDPNSPHASKSGTFLELGTVKLGAPLTDTVILRSTFDADNAVDLYPADAQPAVGGGFGFGARTDRPTQVGAWLKLSAARVTVPAHGQVTVRTTVTVPKGTQGGEYVGAVVAEPVNQGPAGAVQSRTRFAMAVYLTVPGGPTGSTPGRGKPDGTLTVLAVDPHYRGNLACPVVKLRNDSQAIVDPTARVTTKGWFGSGSSATQSRTAALLPGVTASVALRCIKRPFGPGSVHVVIASPKGGDSNAIDYVWLPMPLFISLLFLLLLIAALLTTFARGWLRRGDEDGDAAERPAT